MNQKLIIIDGSSLLSTSFYGTLDSRYNRAKTPEERQVFLDKIMRNAEGEPTNGVFAMMKSMDSLIGKINPSHLVVAWDISRNTFRREIYPLYKGTRKDPLPELKSQFPIAQSILEELGIKHFMYNRYEADDVIGTFAENFKAEIPVAIWTKDQDALQLIDENVSVWLITSKADEYYEKVYGAECHKNPVSSIFPFNEESFEIIYDIKPIQIIDLKAIEGDTSDNIPGIRGVGEKTASALIKEFGSLEAIYDCLENSSEKELKDIFTSIGISSPLKKMMDVIDFKSVVEELATEIFACDPNIGEEYANSSELSLLLMYLEDIDKKRFKEKMKEFSKYESCKKIIDKVGTFVSGQAKDIAMMSKKLATIVRDIEELKMVPLDSLAYEVNKDTRSGVYAKYGFNSLNK